MRNFLKIFYTTLAISPLVVWGAPQNVTEAVNFVVGIIELIIPLVAGVALLVFFWGIAKFIASAGNEDKLSEGKLMMFWGAIALFVMFSIWGLTAFVSNTFFPGAGVNIIPQLWL